MKNVSNTNDDCSVGPHGARPDRAAGVGCVSELQCMPSYTRLPAPWGRQTNCLLKSHGDYTTVHTKQATRAAGYQRPCTARPTCNGKDLCTTRAQHDDTGTAACCTLLQQSYDITNPS